MIDINILFYLFWVEEELSKQFRTNTECLLKSLPDVGKKRSYREIPAFTKPLS